MQDIYETASEVVVLLGNTSSTDTVVACAFKELDKVISVNLEKRLEMADYSALCRTLSTIGSDSDSAIQQF